ncbi:MAG: hypothetical protein AAFY11_02585 [Cyanobacteria bacterium J06641_5]
MAELPVRTFPYCVRFGWGWGSWCDREGTFLEVMGACEEVLCGDRVTCSIDGYG